MRILGDTSHMASACCAHRLQLRKLMTVSHAELAYVLRMNGPYGPIWAVMSISGIFVDS